MVRSHRNRLPATLSNGIRDVKSWTEISPQDLLQDDEIALTAESARSTLAPKSSNRGHLLEHPVLTALGATTITLEIMLAGLVSPSNNLYYHYSGTIPAVIIPVLVNFAAVWLILALLLSWARRHPRWQNAILGLLAIGLGWMVLRDVDSLSASPISRSADLAYFCGVALAVAILLRAPANGRLVRHMRGLFLTLLAFLGVSGALVLVQVLSLAWRARDLNTPHPLHQRASLAQSTAQPAPPHGRILWIVFDELSYRQVYEHRYPGLELPTFDRLAQSSTVFTHAVPVGVHTENVLPALMTGEPINGVHAPPAGLPLSLHNRITRTWETLDPRNTVFQDALNAGYSTAVAGWYNPYCRILPSVLDRCFWTARSRLPFGLFPGQSIAWNSEQPILRHLLTPLRMVHLLPESPSPELIFHQQDYFDLYRAGDQMLADSQTDFLLLHMPIPHPMGIYNRHTASFTVSYPSYLDNLALCDVYLAHVREEMERDGTWDDATLVIMGDHSWRVHLGWALAPEWTHEETVASDNATFDNRPFYLVKLPHQTTATRIDTPFAALRTRSLFDQILTGKIETPQQLATWAH